MSAKHDDFVFLVGAFDEFNLRINDFQEEFGFAFWEDLNFLLTGSLRHQVPTFQRYGEIESGLDLVDTHILIQDIFRYSGFRVRWNRLVGFNSF